MAREATVSTIFEDMVEERARARRYLLCYSLRSHAYVIVDPDFDTKMGDPLQLRCTRCDTVRRSVISRVTGRYVTSHRYKWRDDYKYGHERPTGDQFRRMLLMDQIDKARAGRTSRSRARAS